MKVLWQDGAAADASITASKALKWQVRAGRHHSDPASELKLKHSDEEACPYGDLASEVSDRRIANRLYLNRR